MAKPDPLIPARTPPDPSEPDLLIIDGAVGRIRIEEPDLDSLAATWQTRREYRLNAWIDSPDRPAAMDRLMTRWRERVPRDSDPDSSAVIYWPSRDTSMTPVFLEHGLVPKAVVAVRPAGRPWPVPGVPVAVRTAGPDDIEALVRLELMVVDWDQQFGVVFPRAATPREMRKELAGALANEPLWTWLAEVDGEAVGMLRVEPPAESSWFSSMVGPAPAAYLATLGVSEQHRGAGIAAALVSAAHRALDGAGAAVTLLHYAALNPLSGPFWHRAGYRPLWTSWQARPAERLR